MIKKLSENLYVLPIPLPNSPLKATNSYYIRGEERNLLIDTAFNQQACRTAMDLAIRELGINLEKTDIFITHLHSDHSGLAGYLAKAGSKVYCSSYYAKGMREPNSFERELQFFQTLLEQSGLFKMGLAGDLSIHPGYKYASSQISEVTPVEDGQVLKVGPFSLRCIETVGHTPEHLCLYETERKILFSGDHILAKITPNNTIWEAPWTAAYDYLGAYLDNLDKIALFDIELTLPGHREPIPDCYTRIEELKAHHQRRLNQILDIVGKGKMTGAEVASRIEWDLTYKSWEDFPPTQKLFAVGEALSHLTHLVLQKALKKELDEGVVYYSII